MKIIKSGILHLALIVNLMCWLGCFVPSTGQELLKRELREYKYRIELGSILPHLGYSTCGRCGVAWLYVDSHCTDCYKVDPDTIPKAQSDTCYTSGWGFCPLCVYCWEELTPEQRLPYYKKAWDRNTKELMSIKGLEYREQAIQHRKDWWLVKKAVLEGL